MERQVGYSEIYEELNHQAEERFELMEERMAQICSKAETKEQFADYFQKNAAFLLMLARLYRDKKDSKSATELKQHIRAAMPIRHMPSKCLAGSLESRFA